MKMKKNIMTLQRVRKEEPVLESQLKNQQNGKYNINIFKINLIIVQINIVINNKCNIIYFLV